MPALFAFTLAVSAALLFAVQPMVARMALPILGGTPAVWNSCMVFFQASVLGGYGLAHFLAKTTCRRTQVGLFLAVIVLGVIGLPISIADAATHSPAEPLAWLLGRLTREVALPAVALAITSPLLQHWLSSVRKDPRAPYSLYVASNVGSLGALVAYPALIEPALPLAEQSSWWTTAYQAWGILIFLCGAWTLVRARRAGVECDNPEPDTAGQAAAPPSWKLRLAWVGLGAIPASLLQGCTLFLTTDVASIPLLWVVPLALYLLSFVIAFSARGQPAVRVANRLMPFLASALLFAILSRSTQPVLVLIGLHLVFLLGAGLVAHGRLVALQPPAEHLTAFYLALSLGGVLGGSFNALLAPRLFHSVAEYPIAIALACCVLPDRTRSRATPTTSVRVLRELAWAVVVAVGLAALGLVVPWLARGNDRLRDAIVFGIPTVVCCAQLDRPLRLGGTLAAAFLAGLWMQSQWAGTRFAERNFFGITRVTRAGEGRFHQLVHGNTIHGRQFTDPARRGEPLTYYHRDGPLGTVFAELQRNARPRRIGAIGLGIGSVAAYATSGEDWTFYEIDPAVIHVARDTNWFHFLADTRADACRIVEGDARLSLGAEPDGQFDLLILDAFSSDAIPVHLLTREALALYERKLRPGGWLLAHISNRYLELEPVVSALALDAGMVCRSADDPDENPESGKEPSHWMLLARTASDLRGLGRQSRWVPANPPGAVKAWTDQRAPVLEVFEWH